MRNLKQIGLSKILCLVGGVVLMCASVRADTMGTLTATLNTGINGGYPSPADIVYISYSSANGSINTAAYAGEINWSLKSGYSGLGSTFSTYCVDILSDITVGPNYAYNVVNNGAHSADLNSLGGLGLSNSTAATAEVTEIEKLWAADYGLIGNNSDYAAAFQIDLWQIIYGNSSLTLNLNYGTAGASASPLAFGVYGGQSGWETTAQTWLNNLSSETATVSIVGLKKTTIAPGPNVIPGIAGQDQAITAGSTPDALSPSGTSTPLPMPLVGTAFLLLALGGSTLLRFARHAVAAQIP